jgi:hypothetical protein
VARDKKTFRNAETRGPLSPARRGRRERARIDHAILCAGLLGLSLATGCMGGWGSDFYTKGVAPSKAPSSALVIEGQGQGAPAATFLVSVRELVSKEAGIGVRTLTPEELAAAKSVTSNKAACELGKSVGEALIVWSLARRRSEPAFKCLKTDVEMTPKGDVKEICLERSGEPTGVIANIAIELRVVDNRAGQCVEIGLERAVQRAEAETEDAAALEAERLAWVDIAPKLLPVFTFDPTVIKAKGDWGEIDPGRDSGPATDELFNVVRDGAHVGTAVITRVSKKGTEARLLRGKEGMQQGDILTSTSPSASCCVELRPFFSGAVITTPAGDPRFAYGGGFHVEWYQPVHSLLFGASLEKTATAKGTTTDLVAVHAGYQLMPWPRTFGFFGRLSAGWSTSHLDVERAGKAVTANASGGVVSGVLGVKLGLSDAFWLNAEGGYRLASEHDGWSATNAEGEDLDPPISIPNSSNVNVSGALFSLSLVYRFWPY